MLDGASGEALTSAAEAAAQADVPLTPEILFVILLPFVDPLATVISPERVASALHRAAELSAMGASSYDDIGAVFESATRHALESGEANVRPLHLLIACADVAPLNIGAMLDDGRSLLSILSELRERVASEPPLANEDEPHERVPPRFRVVVRGVDFLDTTNAYSTLREAQIAVDVLRAKTLGMPRTRASNSDGSYTLIHYPQRLREATSIEIERI